MFVVGGNTANNAFQLAMQQVCIALQVAAICCSYYFTLCRTRVTKFQHLKGEHIVNCLSYLVFQEYFRLPKRFNASQRNTLTELKSILRITFRPSFSWRRRKDVKMLRIWCRHRTRTTLGLLGLGQQIIHAFMLFCMESSFVLKTPPYR